MNTPLWLWFCLSWHLPLYVALVLALTAAAVWAVLRLGPALPDRDVWLRRCLRTACPAALIVQAGGFAGMFLALMEGGTELSAALRQTAYGTFSVFRLPLGCFVLCALVLYAVLRYGCFRKWPADSLTQSVAAAVAALVASPWVLMLPVSL